MSSLINAPYFQARELAKDIETYGASVPLAVQEALAALDKLEKIKPAVTGKEELIRAYEGADAKQIESAASAAVSQSMRHEAWGQARINLGMDALHGFRDHAPEIIAELGKKARPLIKQVVGAANLPTLDAGELIRKGRASDAELAARYTVAAAELDALYSLRDRLNPKLKWTISRHFDCRTWKRVDLVIASVSGSGLALTPEQAFLRGIKAGGELWWPTPEQSIKESQQLEDARIAELRKAEQRLAKAGKLSGFGNIVTR